MWNLPRCAHTDPRYAMTSPPCWPACATGSRRQPGECFFAMGPIGSLRRARHDVPAEFRHHLLCQEPHGVALPGGVGAAPVESGHEQGAEWADLLAEGDELV